MCFQIVSRATFRPKWLTLFRRFDFSLTHVDSFSIAPLKHVFFFGSTNTDVYKGFSRVWKIFQTADNESYNRCNWLYRVTSTAPCTRPCLRSCSSGVSCTTSRVRTTLARFQRARPSATADCNSLILLNRLVLIYLNKLRWRVRFHTDYASA